ncbi:MAG: hypothetical protein ACYTEX_27920 [Planctomycetota bacterium]
MCACGEHGLVEYYEFYGSEACSIVCTSCGNESAVKRSLADARKDFEAAQRERESE